MARSPIPMTMQEWPEYEYKPFPKQVGLDADGNQIIAHKEDEIEGLQALVVYPKKLGKDKNGKALIAQHPSQEVWMTKLVVKDVEEPKLADAKPSHAKNKAA